MDSSDKRLDRSELAQQKILQNQCEPGAAGLRLRPIKDCFSHRPWRLDRLFDENGSTFTEYVMAQRPERAQRLLSDPQLSDRTLTAIAFAAGFNDLSHFQRRFRRRSGARMA